MSKLVESHRLVLEAMTATGEDDHYWPFRTIASESGVPLHQIRRIVRHLARKGFTQYARGLSDEDGKPAGSGYCITSAGHAILAVDASARGHVVGRAA